MAVKIGIAHSFLFVLCIPLKYNVKIPATINKIADLADVLQVCLDSGAKKVLLPASAASDLGSVPSELASKFSLLFIKNLKKF